VDDEVLVRVADRVAHGEEELEPAREEGACHWQNSSSGSPSMRS